MTATHTDVEVTFKTGFVYKDEYWVEEPRGMVGEMVREMTPADWVAEGKDPLYDTVAGAGLVAQWRLTPSNLNYEKLVVREGIAPMAPKTGCFEDESMFPPADYAHTVANGALRKVDLTGGNKWALLDAVAVQLGWPPQEGGAYRLAIPIQWGKKAGSDFRSMCLVNQDFELVLPDYTSVIRKGNLQLVREVP